jgi:hypothetical protein
MPRAEGTSVHLDVRLHHSELARLRWAAEKAGLGLAGWVRLSLFAAAGLDADPARTGGFPRGRKRAGERGPVVSEQACTTEHSQE